MNWNPHFFRTSPLFWPIAAAAARLEGVPSFPDAGTLTRLLAPAAPLVFERSPAKPRRNREPPRPEDRYDARIALGAAVPTRERSWHDLLNALVWVTFPKAKRALHARQHSIITAQVGDDLRVPGARTKEQDAVAMLDEGGVVLVGQTSDLSDRGASGELTDERTLELLASGAIRQVVFGHAIYESCITKPAGWVRALAWFVPMAGPLSDDGALLQAVDRALEELLRRTTPLGRGDFSSTIVRW